MRKEIARLNALAIALKQEGHLNQALNVVEQAVELARLYLGTNHSEYAINLGLLATICMELGDYTRAEQLHHESCFLIRQTFGPKHLEYARSLTSFAILYEHIGRYSDSLNLCIEALEIKRECVGEKHPSFGLSLNNLGGVLELMGALPLAESMYMRAAEIRKNTLGESHPDYAQTLGNIGSVLSKMREYRKAKDYFEQAAALELEVFGSEHPTYGRSLNNLALILKLTGEEDRAQSLLQKATEITQRKLGEKHPQYATCLGNLALIARSKGDYTKAESYKRRSLEILRYNFGDNHQDVGSGYEGLANLLWELGKVVEARHLLKKCLKAYTASLGNDHTAVSRVFCSLAAVTLASKLTPSFQTWGAKALYNLAAIIPKVSDSKEIINYLVQAIATEDQILLSILSSSNERHQTNFLNSHQGTRNILFSIACFHPQYAPKIQDLAFSFALRRKAISAEVLVTMRDLIGEGVSPGLASKMRNLNHLRMQIAQKTLAEPESGNIAAHRQVLTEWNTEKEKLEEELARQMPEMNLEQKLRTIDRQVVALALPEGASLIEFVRFDVFDFKAVPARVEPQSNPARYVAFVLPAGEPSNVQMIDLGEAEPIDAMIDAFREAMIGEEASDAERIGKDLRAAVFDPVQALHSRTRLLIAPDGELSRLPFEILPMDDGRHLIDEYQISYLSAGRDVIRFGASVSGKPSAPVVIAAPNFDLGIDTPQEPGESSDTRGRHSRNMTWSEEPFEQLPSAGIEGAQIATQLQNIGLPAELWLAERAVEQRIKECRSPRILHLATHGFFLEDQHREMKNFLRSFGMMEDDRFAGAGMESPLLRSGLALAGANWKHKNFIPPPEAEDGILTAEDVTGLDLLATDMVVLSACETGLGEIQIGEGVLGLRRAFVLAGAKTLVMSLWKVADIATAILMTKFYNILLQPPSPDKPPLGRFEALREAQFYLRDVTIGELRDKWLTEEIIERFAAGDEEYKEELQELAARPDSYRPFESPYFWGAFILQGDPSPLPSPER